MGSWVHLPVDGALHQPTGARVHRVYPYLLRNAHRSPGLTRSAARQRIMPTCVIILSPGIGSTWWPVPCDWYSRYVVAWPRLSKANVAGRISPALLHRSALVVEGACGCRRGMARACSTPTRVAPCFSSRFSVSKTIILQMHRERKDLSHGREGAAYAR